MGRRRKRGGGRGGMVNRRGVETRGCPCFVSNLCCIISRRQPELDRTRQPTSGMAVARNLLRNLVVRTTDTTAYFGTNIINIPFTVRRCLQSHGKDADSHANTDTNMIRTAMRIRSRMQNQKRRLMLNALRKNDAPTTMNTFCDIETFFDTESVIENHF